MNETPARKEIFNTNLNHAIGDQLESILSGINFAGLETSAGKSSRYAAFLGMVTILQFVEELTDEQAADASGARMDWKYALHLPLYFPGLATDCNDPRADNLKAWHFKGTGLGWELAGGTGGTVTCNPGGISNVTVSGVTDFSAFVISTGNPTAITLNSLSAHPGSPWLLFVILAFALGLVFISGTLFLALKRRQTA